MKYTTENLKKRVIVFHPIFKHKLGTFPAAILLQQVAHWSNTKPDGWFYKTRDEWEQETVLTRNELENARKKLLKLRLIEYETRGANNRGWYRLNNDVFEMVFGETENNTQEKTTKKTTATKKTKTAFTKDTAEVLDCFAKNVNPDCETMYNRVHERQAAEWLLKKTGDKERLFKAIKLLKKWNTTPYLKSDEKAFKPSELKRNFSAIEARSVAERNKSKQNRRKTII